MIFYDFQVKKYALHEKIAIKVQKNALLTQKVLHRKKKLFTFVHTKTN